MKFYFQDETIVEKHMFQRCLINLRNYQSLKYFSKKTLNQEYKLQGNVESLLFFIIQGNKKNVLFLK